MQETPPLVVDVDGTLTGPEQAVAPAAMTALAEWPAPVVVATGKAFPFPVALCQFVGVEPCVVAENGGVVFVGQTDELVFGGDPDAVDAFVADYRDRGHTLGWGGVDLANRWRETEVAISLDQPREPIDELADEHGLEVVDTGYAYHVKSPGVDKGLGLEDWAASPASSSRSGTRSTTWRRSNWPARAWPSPTPTSTRPRPPTARLRRRTPRDSWKRSRATANQSSSVVASGAGASRLPVPRSSQS